MEKCTIREATHVQIKNGQIKKILKKYGIRKDGTLKPPSEGGFGVVTEDYQIVTMLEAQLYFKEELNEHI
jgi:hypothetical protein